MGHHKKELMPFLFEYGEWASIANSKDLKQMLQSIWSERLFAEQFSEDERPAYQPFLQFDGDAIRARNYSGFIQRENEIIEIYPKVFREHHCQDKTLMLNHIF